MADSDKPKPIVTKKPPKDYRDSRPSSPAKPATPKPTTKPVVRAGGKTDDYKVTRKVWEDIKSRNRGRAGSASKIWMMEELEPYMGSFPTTGEGGRGLFPGLVPVPKPTQYGGYGGDDGGGGGGGGGGGVPVPAGPKIRTSTGIRRSPYWESEDPIGGGFQPRFVVLGDSGQW